MPELFREDLHLVLPTGRCVLARLCKIGESLLELPNDTGLSHQLLLHAVNVGWVRVMASLFCQNQTLRENEPNSTTTDMQYCSPKKRLMQAGVKTR